MEVTLSEDGVRAMQEKVMMMLVDLSDTFLYSGDLQSFIEIQCVMGMIEEKFEE
jgi:hypothetical protein